MRRVDDDRADDGGDAHEARRGAAPRDRPGSALRATASLLRCFDGRFRRAIVVVAFAPRTGYESGCWAVFFFWRSCDVELRRAASLSHRAARWHVFRCAPPLLWCTTHGRCSLALLLCSRLVPVPSHARRVRTEVCGVARSNFFQVASLLCASTSAPCGCFRTRRLFLAFIPRSFFGAARFPLPPVCSKAPN